MSAWQECTTDDGYTYYWNRITNETSWEKPTPISTRVPPPVPGRSPTMSSSPSTTSFMNSVPVNSPSVETENPKSHSGWLMKKGVIRKNWKRRFFYLDGNGYLYYFANQEGLTKAKASGKDLKTLATEVANRTCGPVNTVGKGYQNCFQVVNPSRVYLMYSSTVGEFNTWKDKLVENGGKWEGRLERMSMVNEDGSVDFDQSQKPNDVSFPSEPMTRVAKTTSPPTTARPEPVSAPIPIYTTPTIVESPPLNGPKDIGTPTLASKPNPIVAKRRARVDSIELSKPKSYQ